MQMAITFMAVIAGLIFSIAVALLAEELIFGQVFRVFFAPQKLARQTVLQNRDKSRKEKPIGSKGERPCWL
jgi:hypothetical protein